MIIIRSSRFTSFQLLCESRNDLASLAEARRRYLNAFLFQGYVERSFAYWGRKAHSGPEGLLPASQELHLRTPLSSLVDRAVFTQRKVLSLQSLRRTRVHSANHHGKQHESHLLLGQRRQYQTRRRCSRSRRRLDYQQPFSLR